MLFRSGATSIFSSTTASIGTASGALVVSGGVGIGGNINLGTTGNIYLGGIPLLPVLTVGVWLWNAGNAPFPIFGSISDLGSWAMNDIDNYWVVLPGYKVRVYIDVTFTGQNFTCDNTLGSFVRRYVITDSAHFDKATSCRVFYKNVEVTEVVTVSNVTYGIVSNAAGNIFT